LPRALHLVASLAERCNSRTRTAFRSSFRDWAAEQTNFPREVAEAALAHAVQSRVEAAYRRSDLFDKRRLLMDKWARYCGQVQDEGGGKILEMKPTGGRVKKK
jgi:integrase